MLLLNGSDAEAVHLAFRADASSTPASGAPSRRNQRLRGGHKRPAPKAAPPPDYDDTSESESYYVVLITISKSAIVELEPGHEPDDYVYYLEATVLFSDENGDRKSVGKFTGHIVDVDRAIRERTRVFDVFDAHSQELCDIWFALYSSHARLADPVQKLVEGPLFSPNVLVVSDGQIEPAHRGRRLGLLVMQQIAEHLKSFCGIAVLKPFPLQHGSARKDKAWMRRYGSGLQSDLRAGVSKLRKYWAQLGFRRIPRSEFFVANANRVQLMHRG